MLRTSPLLAGLSCVVAVHAHGPSRQKVTEEIAVNAPADRVWDIIAEFCSIETWHPGVVTCNGEGGIEPGATRGSPLAKPAARKYTKSCRNTTSGR